MDFAAAGLALSGRPPLDRETVAQVEQVLRGNISIEEFIQASAAAAHQPDHDEEVGVEMDQPTVYWIQSRIDRVRLDELRDFLVQVKTDLSGELLADLEEALTILEALLHKDVRTLLAIEVPGLVLPRW